jgi:hypothetical protein
MYLPVGLLLLSYGVLIVVVALNWRLRGFVLVLLGLVVNAAVIAVNQGMPVSRAAIIRSENLSLLEDLPKERGGAYHESGPDDVVRPLTDVIAVREPFGVVVSVGDIATYSGASLFLAAAMLGRSDRRRTAAPRSARHRSVET